MNFAPSFLAGEQALELQVVGIGQGFLVVGHGGSPVGWRANPTLAQSRVTFAAETVFDIKGWFIAAKT
jgi:hypothetical protein